MNSDFSLRHSKDILYKHSRNLSYVETITRNGNCIVKVGFEQTAKSPKTMVYAIIDGERLLFTVTAQGIAIDNY